jgi:hypothetical protein
MPYAIMRGLGIGYTKEAVTVFGQKAMLAGRSCIYVEYSYERRTYIVGPISELTKELEESSRNYLQNSTRR